MNPSHSTSSRGRVTNKGHKLPKMANGDTTNRTTTFSSKLNKNNNQTTQNQNNSSTAQDHAAVNNTSASNRVTPASPAEKATSGPGGRVRRRSAPPVTLEGT